MANINPQFNEIGTQLYTHYYQTFDTNRAGLAGLYGDTSMMTFEGEQFQGAQGITGIIVFVTGNLIVDGGAATPLKFAQVFHLAPTPQGSWFIQNDMFRLNIG